MARTPRTRLGPYWMSMLGRVRIPHVFVLLTVLVFVVSLASYVVPSGRFERETRLPEIGIEASTRPDLSRESVSVVAWRVARHPRRCRLAGRFNLTTPL